MLKDRQEFMATGPTSHWWRAHFPDCTLPLENTPSADENALWEHPQPASLGRMCLAVRQGLSGKAGQDQTQGTAPGTLRETFQDTPLCLHPPSSSCWVQDSTEKLEPLRVIYHMTGVTFRAAQRPSSCFSDQGDPYKFFFVHSPKSCKQAQLLLNGSYECQQHCQGQIPSLLAANNSLKLPRKFFVPYPLQWSPKRPQGIPQW